jgi:peroxiredoxin
MKTLLLTFAAAAGIAGVLQDDRAAVNKTCPVMKGKLIKKEILSVYENKPIGFCCDTCKKIWDEDPAEYAANLTEAEPPKVPQRPLQMGKPAPEFEARDAHGHVVKLADYKDKIVIVQWTDSNCPVARRLAEKVTVSMIENARKASDKVVHLSVCSDTEATGYALNKFLTAEKIDSRGLMDVDGGIARLYGVGKSCHALVIDAKGALRYWGAVDNDPAGKKGDKVVNHVVDAVKAIVEDKKVSPDKTNAYGTPLKPPK